MYTIVTICLDDEDEEEVPLPVCATIVGRLCKGTKASTEEARKLAKECLRSSVPLQLTSGQVRQNIIYFELINYIMTDLSSYFTSNVIAGARDLPRQRDAVRQGAPPQA